MQDLTKSSSQPGIDHFENVHEMAEAPDTHGSGGVRATRPVPRMNLIPRPSLDPNDPLVSDFLDSSG